MNRLLKLEYATAAKAAALPLGLLALTAPASLVAQAAPAPAPAAAPVPAVSQLSQIPGVTIKPYGVTGTKIEEFRASMAAQRPTNPQTGQPVPSGSSWSIGANIKKQTTGTVCKVIGVEPKFSAEVTLPRLANPEGTVVAEPVLAEWQRFVAGLDSRHAEHIRLLRSRLPELQQAGMGKECTAASAAINAKIEEINKTPPPPPPAPPPAPEPAPAPAKKK